MKKNHKTRLFSTILACIALLGFGGQSSHNALKGSAAVYPNQAANEVTTTVTYYDLHSEEESDIYEGSLEEIVDGNDESYCWFRAIPNANSSHIQLTFSEAVTIYNVRVLFDTKVNLNDRMIGEVQYSTDGVNFTSLGRIDKNEQILRLDENPVQATHLRLLETESNGGSWVKIFDFSINSNIPEPSYSGLTFIDFIGDVEWNKVDNMTDGDIDTYAWFDWKNQPNADITLKYSQVQEVRNIYMLTAHPNTNDHFQKMKFYYSLDGNDYTQVGDDLYVEQKEVLIELPSPVQAKYIRVVCPETQDMGFAIREFGINHIKVNAPITFTNETPYTYTSEGLTPTYTIPFLTEAKIEYTSHEAHYSYEAPVKPGWYALVVTVLETAYYQETTLWTVFCIQDTKEHFISEWNLAMSKGVCDYATNRGDMSNYEYLLEVYNECMTDEVRNEVSNYQWSENSTILETMQYIETLRSSYTSQEATQASSLIYSIHETNSMVMMIVIIGFGLALIGGYYLLNKKRVQ